MAANVTRHADNFLLALKTIKNAEAQFGVRGVSVSGVYGLYGVFGVCPDDLLC